MSGISYTMPRFQAIDQNGRPMVGATLYTYKNKTTTPHPTWEDKDQTAYNTNPIVLDARGEAVVWLDPEQVYTFVLRDWFGVLVWSQDDVSGGAAQIDLAAPDGASMVGFIQAGYGAVARTMLDKAREVVSVEDFGAVGDGVTDDSAAFVKALAVHDAIFLPPGKRYFLSSSVPFGSNKRVYGVNGVSEIIVANNVAFSLSGAKVENAVMAGFVISSTADVGSTTQGLINCDGPETDGIILEDIVFDHPNHGRNSIFFKSRPTAETNNVTLRRIKIKGSGRMGIEVIQHEDATTAYGRGITIEDCDIGNTGGKDNGMGISVSGGLADIKILRNKLRDNPYAHIEIPGPKFNCEIGYNTFDGEAGYHVISSNNPGGNGYWFHDNKSMPGCDGYWHLASCPGAIVERNNIAGDRAYINIATNSLTVRRNTITTKQTRCIFVDNSPNNDIYENYLDNSQAASNASVLSLYNTGATGNRVFNNTWRKGPGGSDLIQENGASGNLFRNNDNYLNPSPRDLVSKLGINTLTISFLQSFRGLDIPLSSWAALTFEIVVAGSASGGGSRCAAQLTLCVSYVKGSVPVVINSAEMVIFDNGVNLSVSTGTNTITITTSPPSGSYLRWEVKLPKFLSDQYIILS